MHRKRSVCLILAGIVATMSAATAIAMAAGLTGAGSTLVQPLMARWTADFQHKTGIAVTYQGVGSGTGISLITSRSVSFGASDAPLTGQQRSACGGCVEIPWALTATAIGYHVNGVHKLHLSGAVLAKIYLGQITNWDSSQIKAINKGKHLPNLKITPIYRSDSSGDSYAFTDFVSRVSSGFRHQIGTTVAPAFQHGAGFKGNSGVTAAVAGTNGSVGYIAASYLILHGIPAAQVENAAGHFEYPNLTNIAAAGASLHSVPANNEIHIADPSAAYPKAYPISTFTYAIVPSKSSSAGSLSRFIRYAVSSSGQRFGPALDFAPLPAKVKNAAIKSARKLHS